MVKTISKKKAIATAKISHSNKVPSAFSQDILKIKFSTSMMEFEGPFSWTAFQGRYSKVLLDILFHAQDVSWTNLREQGSHYVEYQQMSQVAKKRIKEKKWDETADYFSLRKRG